MKQSGLYKGGIMWLGDPIQYKDYGALQKLMQALLNDYAAWRNNFSIETDTVNADERYAMPEANKGGFKALPVIDGRKVQEKWSLGWNRSMKAAFQIEGMIDMCINFIRPGKMLPVHHDGYVWDWIRQSVGDPSISGYTVSFGIDIPDPENQALIFDGVKRVWKTGEFRAFNGHDIQHQLVNNATNPGHWRVTAVMEIEGKYFNI
jgi:hypothetical protein